MNWQPIETAPKFTPILIHWSAGLGFDGTTKIAMLAEWDESKPVDNESPTHWMALPEPPE